MALVSAACQGGSGKRIARRRDSSSGVRCRARGPAGHAATAAMSKRHAELHAVAHSNIRKHDCKIRQPRTFLVGHLLIDVSELDAARLWTGRGASVCGQKKDPAFPARSPTLGARI